MRKLIEYEDYAIRVLDDEAFTVAHTYGIVELTPDREYILATGFFEEPRHSGMPRSTTR